MTAEATRNLRRPRRCRRRYHRDIAAHRPGDDLTARLTVVEIDPGKRRVTLDCVCLVGEKAVLKGEALVLAPSKTFD